MSIVLPPGVSDGALERALEDLRGVVGSEHVLTEPVDLSEFRDPFWHLTWDEYEAAAVVSAAERRGGAGDCPHRERAPRSAVGHLAGSQQRLRRIVPARSGLGRREPAPNEPCPRDQRGARIRGGRAGRALVRSLRRDQGRRARADALLRRSRLGQRDRQHARPRLHLPALRRGYGGAVRHGGRARERRAPANRHGGDAGQPRLARLQARARTDRRPAVHAVELRHRHEDGRLADALPGGLHADLGPRLARRRPRADPRHAPAALARRHDPDGPSGREHADLRLVHDQAEPVVGGLRADPRASHRAHRPRARGRPLDDARRPLRRRRGRRPSLREGQGGVRADRRGRGLGHEDDAGRGREPPAPRRADPGRRPRPRDEPDDRVVRRRPRAGTWASHRSRP